MCVNPELMFIDHSYSERPTMDIPPVVPVSNISINPASSSESLEQIACVNSGDDIAADSMEIFPYIGNETNDPTCVPNDNDIQSGHDIVVVGVVVVELRSKEVLSHTHVSEKKYIV